MIPPCRDISPRRGVFLFAFTRVALPKRDAIWRLFDITFGAIFKKSLSLNMCNNVLSAKEWKKNFHLSFRECEVFSRPNMTIYRAKHAH